MNSHEPYDPQQAAPSPDDPLAARLASLAPAPAGIDPAVTFYRAGLAAAEAAEATRLRSRHAWLRLAAACLLATAAAGPAGYLIGRGQGGGQPGAQIAQEEARRSAPADRHPADPHRLDEPSQRSAPAHEAADRSAAAQPPLAAPVEERSPERSNREPPKSGDPDRGDSWLALWVAERLFGDPFAAERAPPRDSWNAAGIYDAHNLETLVRLDTPPLADERSPESAVDDANPRRARVAPPTRAQLLEELLD